MHGQRGRDGARLSDGRDELNLADFPISVLQRQQPVDDRGVKVDTAVFEASRYDRQRRQAMQQRVILETSSRHGLPTPADENVVLALLHVAKHTHNFTSPVVHFAPRQLFEIMGWAPNSRSYDRLREVLRRLQALVIRYENSWWDVEGRAYEAEVATGIISEYELGRQVAGRGQGKAPPCWVCWTPQFQRSLSNGNLKKLDLERLFSLRLPTAQRMYRFLDKRFYPPHDPPEVDMDLRDFACGHVGLARVDNVAELKRRLAPAVEELEAIGFIAPAAPPERFYKVRAGVWRVRFRAGPGFPRRPREPEALAPAVPALPPPGPPAADDAACPALPSPSDAPAAAGAHELAAAFYRAWDPLGPGHVGEADLRAAREILAAHGPAAQELLPILVRVVRRRWPECRSFSGAAGKYLSEAIALHGRVRRRAQAQAQTRSAQKRAGAEAAQKDAERRRREARWDALPPERRRHVEEAVLAKHPELARFPALLRDLCLTAQDEPDAP